MSSRLFQNIRERQGLAYAVFSELNPTATPAACRSTPAPAGIGAQGGGIDHQGIPRAQEAPGAPRKNCAAPRTT